MTRVMTPNQLHTPFGEYPKISWETLGISSIIQGAVVGLRSAPFIIYDHKFRTSKFKRTVTGRKNFATLLLSIGVEPNFERRYKLTTQSEDVCVKLARAKEVSLDYELPTQAMWVVAKQSGRLMIALVPVDFE